MVKRRKVLIGAGSLLAGGAAATGTGALTSLTAGSRDIVLEESDDSEAALAIEPTEDPNGAYATTETRGGEEVIVLDLSMGGDLGLNEDGTFYLDNVIKLTLDNDVPSGTYSVRIEDGESRVSPYTGTTDGDDRPFQSPDGNRDVNNHIADLTPGDDVKVGFKIETDKKDGSATSMRFFAQRQ
jgi:hypothetical protein